MPVILGGNTGIYLASLTPPATPLLLDTYPNAAVAYSLRKLRTAYSGSAIRVRRSSDNAEQDIAFVGNDLDTTSMLDFVGYNLFTYSEDISQSVYTKNGLNTTGTPAYIDVETAPDGTLTGDKIIENAVTGNHNVQRSSTGISLIIGQNYNISVYLKQAERTKIRISSPISGSVQTCEVDLTNGAISNNGFANTPIVTAEANGWYRFSVTITSGVTSTQPFSVQLSNGSSFSYTGDGTSGCYVWGFQLSQTSTVKTYQKTVATAGGAGFVTTWYDQSTNANNSTQATAANQAQVVLNGNLILDAITGKITTTWTTDRYTLTNLITTVQLMYHYMVFNRTSNAQSVAGLSKSNNTFPTMLRWLATTGNITSYLNTGITHSTNTTTGSNLITTLRDSSNVVKMFRNNVALTTGVSSDIGATFDSWGNANASTNSGNFAELVHWNSDQEANRTGIETNVNTYWNAY